MTLHPDERVRAKVNVSVYCPDHGALPGERCTPTLRACGRRKALGRAQHVPRRGLVTLADYLRLPRVVGAHDRANGLGTLTLYVDPLLTATEFAWLAATIDEQRPVNLIVRLERDRRTNERRQA